MIPRGIEILVKKASVDGEFRQHLLVERAAAALRIDLELTIAEVDMLSSIPQSQLIAIIGSTRVSPRLRPAFMGYAAAAMLATIMGANSHVIAQDTKPDNSNNEEHAKSNNDNIDISTGKRKRKRPPGIATGSRPDVSTNNNDKCSTGSISGYVRDENGSGVPGALVVVKGANFFATSDGKGDFTLNEIPVGEYGIKASRVGFSESTISIVKVLDNSITTLNFFLVSGHKGIVIIAGNEPEVIFDKTHKERSIDDRDIENQTGDDIDDFIKLVPGVVYE